MLLQLNQVNIMTVKYGGSAITAAVVNAYSYEVLLGRSPVCIFFAGVRSAGAEFGKGNLMISA